MYKKITQDKVVRVIEDILISIRNHKRGMPDNPIGWTPEFKLYQMREEALQYCLNMLKEKKYPCADCGKLRTEAEGGTIFTVCDECWDKHYHPQLKKPEVSVEEIEKVISEGLSMDTKLMLGKHEVYYSGTLYTLKFIAKQIKQLYER